MMWWRAHFCDVNVFSFFFAKSSSSATKNNAEQRTTKTTSPPKTQHVINNSTVHTTSLNRNNSVTKEYKLKMKSSIVFHILSMSGMASAFFTMPGAPSRNVLKTKILDLASQTNRGLLASPEQKDEILQLFEKLERMNPTKGPLKSNKVNGNWSLDYTTSDTILGKGGFPRIGPIIQMIDTKTLSAFNSEVVSYFGVKIPRKITAELSPQSNQFTEVKFKRFELGPIGFDAPDSFRGALDITYLDDEVRLTRGDKGNIFVLTRMD